LRRLFSLVVSALLLLVCAGCESSRSREERALTPVQNRGRVIFQANCALCHNAYKKEPLQGPPLVGVFRKHDLPSGIPATDEHVRETIKVGRRNMPPFNLVLNDEQIDDLLAYLHTL
jgi:mono/diheme cytochrome c family protein